MAVYSFDGQDLKMMLQGAVDLLGQSKDEIDSLNVFPVPDGDTGTNMYQTLFSAVKEASFVESNRIDIVAEAASRGCLLGARGNSGVILSQILQGFARSLQGRENATASDIAQALQEGAEVAYRAVMSPVEGTILTVVRKSAEGAGSATLRSNNLLRVMVTSLKKAFTALNETPDMLPVLKQAGVVDAGGKGFVVILEGILRALKAASPSAKMPAETPVIVKTAPVDTLKNFAKISGSINFTYCTELLLKGQSLPLERVRNDLSPYGDCLLVVGEPELAKVHIHTNHPGLVLEYCLKYGSLHDIKINNMVEQSADKNGKNQITAPGEAFAVISVGAGQGITDIMKSLGTDAVVAGGQTLNPSAGEILNAIEQVAGDKVIVLPNNKNIILAAEQAGNLTTKKVLVVPSRSIPQGLAALLTLNPEDDLETAANKMHEALETVRTGEITRAVRDTVYKGKEIYKGDVIGLVDGDLKASGPEMEKVLEEILAGMIVGEGKLITLYFGIALDEEKAAKMLENMSRKFSGHDFELQFGGQTVYDLIISVE
ncbi:MAG: DAK2 domain-containing protein [Firmicutes bacterium]|nr:DAK2 domain-containing protein [Bacillota bacterium]